MATAGATKVTGVDAAYYYAKDLDRATKFYTDLIGVVPTLTIPGMVSEWTFPSDKNFGIFKSPDGAFKPGSGILFAVDDIEAAVADYKQRGVTFLEDGKITETKVCWMAFAEDSEGNRFVIHKRKTP
jgi:predicted enzyme related to lactoylglutathione lyase